MSKRWITLSLIVVFVGLLVWGGAAFVKPGFPPLDVQVEQQWLAGREQVDAVEFFEKGGVYESVEFPNTDKDYVLPLVKRLKDDFQLKPIVALEEPGRAFGLFVPVPSEPLTRQKIGTAFQEADDQFPGLLTDHWGKRWVSLDWLEGVEIEALKSSQALELMQKEHERVRKNP